MEPIYPPPLTATHHETCAHLTLLCLCVRAHACRARLQVSAAKTSFFVARIVTGLRTQATGVMGRRTKFQTFDIAQLVLHASSEPGMLEYTRAARAATAGGGACGLRGGGVLC
jgi:hypothetical protein